MPLIITTPPTATPVSLAQAKEQCRIADSDTVHDSLIDRLLLAAVADIEGITGALLSPQTVRLDLDGFPHGDLDLTTYPVTSITSVKYDDESNVEQTCTEYYGSLSGRYPRLAPIDCWPGTYCGKPDTVRITMAVGYADSVPADLVHAILMRVEGLFTGTDTDTVVNALTFRHRRLKL